MFHSAWVLSLFLPLAWASCPTDTLCQKDLNRCYKFVQDQSSFYIAEAHCQSLGGHLVSIRNAFETAVIEETAESMFTGYVDYWIGASHISTESWAWTDGTKWSYTHWFPGQPETNSTAAASLGSGLWVTSMENTRKPFVCGLPFTTDEPTPSPSTCPTQVPCPTCAAQTRCPTTAAPKICPTCPAQTTCAPCPTCEMCPPKRAYCEDGWVHRNETKSCYKVIHQVTWYGGENACVSMGAHLTSIHSRAENEFIAGLTGTGLKIDILDMTWIGLRRESAYSFGWSDGSPLDYQTWGTGEPNNHGNSESCVQLWSDYTSHWGIGQPYYHAWNDNTCSDTMRVAVCKKAESF